MANEFNELTDSTIEEGLDTKVIAKQLKIQTGVGSTIFQVVLWVLGIIPGLVFLFMKISAGNYLSKLQQRINRDAARIDNYLEQRVVILQNCAKLLDKAIDLDKQTFTQIAAYRSGNAGNDESRNEMAGKIDALSNDIRIAFENYPDLQAHSQISSAIQQNSYLQQEITAARELYNDTVDTWNRELYNWPTKMIVASKRGYTTRIPFVASKEIKEKAKEVFF